MVIIESYIPKQFGKEYVAINGMAQYSMFIATALGIKDSFDDWIPISRYDGFLDACNKYGLYVEPDVIFTSPSMNKKYIVGGNNITTTFSEGQRFDKKIKNGTVHVFVSKSREIAKEAKKFGWYSVVINNRTTNKPFIDHLRFGRLLGFPDCCVSFFKDFNNWHLYSNPYETLKNTPRQKGKARGSYYCNNFLMDNIYFYIHHLPCSYRCNKTIEYAKKVEESISKVEPYFCVKTREILKKPLLVFGERNYIIFDGIIDEDSISYKEAQYIKNIAKPEDSVDFFDKIMLGNKISKEGGTLIITKGPKILGKIKMRKQWFMIGFD